LIFFTYKFFYFIATALTPRQVLDSLNQHIVGQEDGKRAIAIALRNRWRRQNVQPQFLRDEIVPKNMLMVGPTGVGKTELARRMAKLIDAPFVKCEATKFTEVGFHGRDVDTMIRDLVANSLTLTKKKLKKQMQSQIDEYVEKKLIDLLVSTPVAEDDDLVKSLRQGVFDEVSVELDVPAPTPLKDLLSGQSGANAATPQAIVIDAYMGGGRSHQSTKQKVTVKEAKKILAENELNKRLDDDSIRRTAVQEAQENGIIFIDEIDKVCFNHDIPSSSRSGDASNEGVQRDLLPLVEGCTVETKYGEIDTSKMLFIASGAFHAVKVSDLLPELQGRLPVRVKLNALTESDMYRILTEPLGNLIRQHEAMFATEGVKVTFEDEAIRRVAHLAAKVNEEVENIGARRLHTVMERVVETMSFDADTMSGQTIVVDAAYVDKHVGDLLQQADLKKFIL